MSNVRYSACGGSGIMCQVLVVICQLLVISCAESVSPQDASLTCPNNLTPCGDICTNTDFDFQNCGGCGNFCSTAYADNCNRGNCICGAFGPCGQGTACKNSCCVSPDPTGKLCEFDGVCENGKSCIGGRCTKWTCGIDVCNGLDDDNDGFVDESVDTNIYCYTGPAGTDNFPPCGGGVRKCFNGQYSTKCVGEILPATEKGILICDGVDNDCDGCVDGTYETGNCKSLVPKHFTIVYVIDLSGSMQEEIQAVKEATALFSADFIGNPDIHFCLITIGTMDEPFYAVVQTCVPFEDFITSLSTVNFGNGSAEPSWDVIYLMATGELDLGFRSDDQRVYIMFTDENGQTYRTPPVNETLMCGALTDEIFAVFAAEQYVGDFDECAEIYTLVIEVTMLVNNLQGILGEACQ